MVEPACESRRPRSAWQLAFSRTFGPFFWGRIISSGGIWAQTMVGSIVAFDATGSATTVAVVTTLLFAPPLVLAPMSGRLADRAGPGRQMTYGHIIGGAASGLLAAWLLLVEPAPGASTVVPLLLASLTVGIAFAVTGPTVQSIVADLVQPDEIPAATGLNGLPIVLARAVGPAVGATVATVWSPGVAFLIAAAAQLQFALIASRLHVRRVVAPATGDMSIRGALRHVRQDRVSVLLLLAVTAIGFGSEPFVTLGVPIADALGAGNQYAGWVMSSFGAGTVTGLASYFAVHRRVPLHILTFAGLGALGIGLAALAVSGDPRLTLVAAGICGVGMTTTMTSATTQLQLVTPPHMRGRVMGLWVIAFAGTRPAAGLMTGALSDLTSVGTSLAACAVAVSGAAALCRPMRLAPGGTGTSRGGCQPPAGARIPPSDADQCDPRRPTS